MADYLFRVHHLMCNYCFIGKGYNDKFIENFSAINDDLRHNPHKIIKIVKQSDDICKECKHNNARQCSAEDKIVAIDAKHQQVLELVNAQELSWSQAKSLITTKVTPQKFAYMCNNCEWYSSGICYNQLFKQ